jgi:Tfp pilus assembly protein PilX
MKLKMHRVRVRQAGITLIECLVYVAVFGILLGLGTAALFLCWDQTKAVAYATNDIESALRAGEHWRADIRAATGAISVETTASGQVVTIPEGGKEISYRLAGGELWRRTSPQNVSQLLLPKVSSSQMQSDPRGPVAAWRWELELTERRQETHLPLAFTFLAAPKTTP